MKDKEGRNGLYYSVSIVSRVSNDELFNQSDN